jgi:serine/threonine protein phosphatase 1
MRALTPAVIDLKISKRERAYAVGDIHGCFEELTALDKKIRASSRRMGKQRDKIISVGDLCDRGPDARGVMDYFSRGIEAGTHHLILGNHEMFFLGAFAGIRPDLVKKSGARHSWFHDVLIRVFPQILTNTDSWRKNGGGIVFKSYGADIDDERTWDKIPPDHIRMLFQAPLVIRTPKALLSHALLQPGDVDLFVARDKGEVADDQTLAEAVIRCVWSRELPSARVDPSRRHVSGHTPLETVARATKLGCIQIDTGAVYGRRLSAINLDGFRVISVASKFSCR